MAIARRRFLGALALAPAAVAGCSGPAAAAKPAPRVGEGDAGGVAPSAASGLEAVRAHPLPASAEPAFTFGAAAVRPGGR